MAKKFLAVAAVAFIAGAGLALLASPKRAREPRRRASVPQRIPLQEPPRLRRVVPGSIVVEPHRVQYWLRSEDPDFEEKSQDVIGVYRAARRRAKRGIVTFSRGYGAENSRSFQMSGSRKPCPAGPSSR